MEKQQELNALRSTKLSMCYESYDYTTIKHIEAIFNAVEKNDIAALQKALQSEVMIHTGYEIFQYSLPINDVRRACEIAMIYAAARGNSEIVDVIINTTLRSYGQPKAKVNPKVIAQANELIKEYRAENASSSFSQNI